jgi:hypothetical protein
LCAALAAVLGLAIWSAQSFATPLAASLTASNGEGTFDQTIDCPAGDGPSWRYAYSGVATPLQGPFGGTWNSTVEVHDAGDGHAFIPAGTGRLKVDVDRGGAANLEFASGDCSSAPLTLTQQADGDPEVTGSLPATATGGSGVLRGFSGTGQVDFTFELGPGADNVAQVDVGGNFTVLQPSLGLGTPSAYWRNASDYFARRLSVFIPVVNSGSPTAVGDAFAVRLAQATLGGRTPVAGVPATFARINAGSSAATTATFTGVSPGQTYSLQGRIEGTDALDSALAPLVQSRPVKAPLLP